MFFPRIERLHDKIKQRLRRKSEPAHEPKENAWSQGA